MDKDLASEKSFFVLLVVAAAALVRLKPEPKINK
jgi:hypothetical protein